MIYRDSDLDYANLLDCPGARRVMGISQAICPDWGTRACLDCDLGQDINDCDFECHCCSNYWACPCTLAAWYERQQNAK